MTRVRLVRRLSPGLVAVEFDGDMNVWSKGRTRAPRKGRGRPERRCVLTGRLIPDGALAYRPVRSGVFYRPARLLADAVDRRL